MRTDTGFTPYDWFKNKPVAESRDFRNVIDWLKTRGATEPTVSYILLSPGGFPWSETINPGKIMMLTFEKYPSPMDASLVLNSPGVVLSMLKLVPDGQVLAYAPPAPPPEGLLPPPTQPANPVGVFWYVDTDGKHVHQCADNDTLPDHSLYPSVTPEWIKTRIVGPFGFWQSWKAIR